MKIENVKLNVRRGEGEKGRRGEGKKGRRGEGGKGRKCVVANNRLTIEKMTNIMAGSYDLTF